MATGGGLAPWAVEVQKAAAEGGVEWRAGLVQVRLEGEAVAREGDDVHEVTREGGGGFRGRRQALGRRFYS